MKRASQREVEAVLALDGPARFRHFIKRVVDDERAWGLWHDGWALMATDGGQEVFPLWPSREYADMCRADKWSAYEVEEIGLRDLVDDLLPKLELRALRPAVFPTTQSKGVVATCSELAAALRAEMAQYE